MKIWITIKKKFSTVKNLLNFQENRCNCENIDTVMLDIICKYYF